MKPEYLTWVEDPGFRKKRQKFASKGLGRMSAETRREILITEGEEEVTEHRKEMAIFHHVFINGEYPSSLSKRDLRGRFEDFYFEYTPFHGEEFWQDYHRFIFSELDPNETHLYAGKFYHCGELDRFAEISDVSVRSRPTSQSSESRKILVST